MNATEIKKELHESLLKAQVPIYAVSTWPPKDLPSQNAIWERFGPIVCTADNKVVQVWESEAITITFVGCKSCSTPYAWTSLRGTSTLAKHKCPVKVAAASSSHSMVLWARQHVQPTAGQKQMVLKACAAMCFVDMRPFATVSGAGFQSLLQTVLDIGVSSKNPIRINDLLRDKGTVKQAVFQVYELTRQVLIAQLQAHFNDKMDVGSTLDIWTEPLTSIAYLSVTMHYIDADFKLNARTLQLDQFPDVSHTAKAVLEEFKKCIIPFTGEFGAMNGPLKKQIRVTTDHASNNSGQDGLPSEFDWIGCADHSISTCVSFILDKRTKMVNGKRSKPFYQFYEEAPAVFDLLENCKELITYVKRTGLNKHLTPKLKQGCPTRWNSILIMTNSIACEFNRHYEMLASRDKAQKMDCINQLLLDELVRFLNVFQIATKELEAFKAPTLHLVAHWRKVLLKHCDNVDEERVVKGSDNIEVTLPPDSEGIKHIKQLIKGQITEKFCLTALHAAAAYLDPRQSSNIRNLDVSEELLGEAIAVVKSTMVRNGPPTPTVTVGDKRPATAAAADNRHARRPKRPLVITDISRRGINDYSSDDDEGDSGDDEDGVPREGVVEIQVLAELQAHAVYKLTKSEKKMMKEADQDGSGTGLLLWWKSKTLTWPILARAARSILAVPAASSMSENNFSDSGSTVSKKRNSLKPAMVNMLMFLRSNKDLSRW